MSLVDRIRVLVLHGDPVAQAGLAIAFGRYPDLEVLNAPDPLDGELSLIRPQQRCSADVVVADYPNGMALAIRAARQGNSAASPKVMVIAGVDREWEIRSALAQGVRGYLLAGCAWDELADGVRAVQRGARHLSPQVAARLAESLSLDSLTAREEQVLRLVVEGLSNKAISSRLGIAVYTVKSHLKSTFDKLNVESRTQAVAAVERRGLLRQSHQLTHPKSRSEGEPIAQRARVTGASSTEHGAEYAMRIDRRRVAAVDVGAKTSAAPVASFENSNS
jgi:DNA-binding NarL/FixJ family response regulator